MGHTNVRHRQMQSKALTRFRIGDLIESRTTGAARVVRARVERINGKTLSVADTDGPAKWRVSPTMCRLVGA